MRSLLFFALVLPIVAHAASMGPDDARHLLQRAGFGAPPREIESFAQLSRAQAVDRLLEAARASATTPPPEWTREPPGSPRALRRASPEERRALLAREFRRGADLRTWWMGEMLATPSPLTERMTLFWHNHFVSSQQKVLSAKLMYDQNALLRRHALGNFGELLHAAAKDPAMIVYLDSASNRKGQPNENFAREVMELFTLGEGHYTEADVREAARAFTGWSLDLDTAEFRFRPLLHDRGVKTVLGRSGHLDGDDVLDILLARPETAEFVVAKLWRELVSPDPDASEVRRIARGFRATNYDIKTAVREILLTPAFWAEESRGALIKSPVDLVVGTARQFDFHIGDPFPLAAVSAQLGQNLFSPPNVRGWPGGEAWINSQTLLARKGFVERAFRAEEMRRAAAVAGQAGGRAKEAALRGTRTEPDAKADSAGALTAMRQEARERFVRAIAEIHFDADQWYAQLGPSPSRAAVERTVLARSPVNAVEGDRLDRDLLRQLALDPAYQLK